MSIRVFGLITVLGAFATTAPALSKQAPVATDPGLTNHAPPPSAPTRRELLLNEILLQLTEQKAQSKSEVEQRHLDQLGSLYSKPDAVTYWTTDQDIRSNVAAIRAEFEKADYWGLDAKYFEIPDYQLLADTDIAALADVEISVSLITLKYAHHAFGGRVDPTKLSLWLGRGPRSVDATTLIPKLASSEDPAKALQSLHPKHPQFAALLKAYRQRKFPDQHPIAKDDSDLIIPAGPNIKEGSTHPQIGLIRRRLGVPVMFGTDVYDKRLADAVAKIMKNKRWKYRKTTIDKWVRRALNEGPKAKKAKLKSVSARKLVINMDRWRRMPERLGRLHIRNNLPTYETRLFKNDELIHQERIIIGKANTQTPVFSDTMNHVVFKPNWGVPTSIKIRQLLPRLRGGDYSVLSRRGMRIVANSGRTISPRRFNWNRVSIADVPIYQGPGSSNPLGQVKFMFPNKHAVYMHDTPNKSLFKSKTRTFSHGCIRVRNPKRLAEILLAETKGWDKTQVHANFRRKSKGNNRIDLDENVRVHNTYFTLVVAENGDIESYQDIYGHDERIGKAMNGVSAKKIASSDPARAQKKQLKQLAKSGYAIKKPSRRASLENRQQMSRLGMNQYPGFIDPYAPAYAKKYKKKKYRAKKYKSRRSRARVYHHTRAWTPF